MISVMLWIPRRGADYTPIWQIICFSGNAFVRFLKIGILLLIGKFLVVKIGWLWLFVIFGGAFLLYMVIIFTLAIRSVREENRRKYGKKDKRVI